MYVQILHICMMQVLPRIIFISPLLNWRNDISCVLGNHVGNTLEFSWITSFFYLTLLSISYFFYLIEDFY